MYCNNNEHLLVTTKPKHFKSFFREAVKQCSGKALTFSFLMKSIKLARTCIAF